MTGCGHEVPTSHLNNSLIDLRIFLAHTPRAQQSSALWGLPRGQDRSRLSWDGQKGGLPSEGQNTIQCDSTWEKRNLKRIPTDVDMYIQKVYFCFNTPAKGRERLHWGRRRVG